MKRSNPSYHQFIFISSIFILFLISYLRYTYYINPNLSRDPILIKIAGVSQNNEDLLELNNNNIVDISSRIKATSIVVFWFLFAIGNFILIRSWRNREKDVIFYLITWIGLTVIVLIFIGFHFILRPEQVFFGLFTKIKNFLLSPLYTGVIFIFAKFFNRIVAKE